MERSEEGPTETHPVPVQQRIPPSHEPLPHDVLELGLGVRVLVERVRHSLVAFFDKRSNSWADKLVEELVNPTLKSRRKEEWCERDAESKWGRDEP